MEGGCAWDRAIRVCDNHYVVPGFDLGRNNLSNGRNVVVDAYETAIDVWMGCIAWQIYANACVSFDFEFFGYMVEMCWDMLCSR